MLPPEGRQFRNLSHGQMATVNTASANQERLAEAAIIRLTTDPDNRQKLRR